MLFKAVMFVGLVSVSSTSYRAYKTIMMFKRPIHGRYNSTDFIEAGCLNPNDEFEDAKLTETRIVKYSIDYTSTDILSGVLVYKCNAIRYIRNTALLNPMMCLPKTAPRPPTVKKPNVVEKRYWATKPIGLYERAYNTQTYSYQNEKRRTLGTTEQFYVTDAEMMFDYYIRGFYLKGVTIIGSKEGLFSPKQYILNDDFKSNCEIVPKNAPTRRAVKKSRTCNPPNKVEKKQEEKKNIQHEEESPGFLSRMYRYLFPKTATNSEMQQSCGDNKKYDLNAM